MLKIRRMFFIKLMARVAFAAFLLGIYPSFFYEGKYQFTMVSFSWGLMVAALVLLKLAEHNGVKTLGPWSLEGGCEYTEKKGEYAVEVTASRGQADKLLLMKALRRCVNIGLKDASDAAKSILGNTSVVVQKDLSKEQAESLAVKLKREDLECQVLRPVENSVDS